MRFDINSVRNGMFVMGTQGERIGKVIRCNDETFVVEKGVFFPKDYELRYDHITDVTGGTIRYALTDFLRGRTPEEATAASTTAAGPALAGGECRRDDCNAASGHVCRQGQGRDPHPAPAGGDRHREGRARVGTRANPQDGHHRGEALLGTGHA